MIKTVLVTGGAGFIGSHLVDGLLKDGYAVRVVDDFSSGSRSNTALFGNRIEVIEGDVSVRSVADRACKGVDAVLHHAAIASVPRSVKDPLATQRAGEVALVNILEASAQFGIKRVVLAASSAAYGDTVEMPKHEGIIPMPLSPYAASKLACEHYIRSFAHSRGVDGISFRYFNIFGPRQDPTSPYSAVISVFLDRMAKGEAPTIFGTGEQTRDFTFVDNVVSANLLALKSEKPLGGEVCNIGCGESVSLVQLAEAMNEVLGTKLKPKFADARAGDVQHSLADISRAKKLVGYQPKVYFKEGLRRLIKGN